MFNDLRPHATGQAQAMESAYQRVIRSGRYILGGEVEAFESEWAEYCEAEYCVAVGNGFDALNMVLSAYDIADDSFVAVPSWTCLPVWKAVLTTGALLVSVEPDDGYNVNAFNLSLHLHKHPRVKAVVLVHMYGTPIAVLKNTVDKFHEAGIRVIEDASQAHGARFVGKRVGHASDATIYSFYPTKNLGAYGDGGAITTNDNVLARRLRKMRNYGGSGFGINSRLDELQAAFLREKLSKLDNQNDRRREIADTYLNKLAGHPLIELPKVPSASEPVWHQFVVKLNYRFRDRIREYLCERGVQTMIHYPVTPFDVIYHNRPSHTNIEAYNLSKEVVSLPVGPHLSDKDVEYIVDVVRRFECKCQLKI